MEYHEQGLNYNYVQMPLEQQDEDSRELIKGESSAIN